MAHSLTNGAAQSVSAQDFNARVKALALKQPDGEKGSKYRQQPVRSPNRPTWK